MENSLSERGYQMMLGYSALSEDRERKPKAEPRRTKRDAS